MNPNNQDVTPLEGCEKRSPAEMSGMITQMIDNAKRVTDQDLGIPSPVPYSVFLRQPSADIDTAGKESTQISSTHKELSDAAFEAENFSGINYLRKFIESAFKDFGVYRLEIVVGDISIKVYKHPNNP